MHRELRVFTGNAHPALAQAIASHLGVPLGCALVTE
jgi:phosphoribosylpyrophosphate synthetase